MYIKFSFHKNICRIHLLSLRVSRDRSPPRALLYHCTKRKKKTNNVNVTSRRCVASFISNQHSVTT